MRFWFSLVLALVSFPAPTRAGAWVLPAGESRFQLKLLHQDTRDRYFLEGERIPFFFEGRSRTSALFADYSRGLFRGLEVTLQVPVFDLRFDDLAAERRSTGLGDVRVGARWNALSDPLVATLGFEVKLPTGVFENDAEVVPVGEGQVDYDVTLELGRSLWPRPGWVGARLGWRFRTPNQENGIDHGDELLWSVEAGHALSRWAKLKLLARGLHGRESQLLGISVPTLRREAIYLVPGLILDLGRSRTLEVSVPISLRGRNWPAGPVFSIGFAQRF